jgi:hypothetical protein
MGVLMKKPAINWWVLVGCMIFSKKIENRGYAFDF